MTQHIDNIPLKWTGERSLKAFKNLSLATLTKNTDSLVIDFGSSAFLSSSLLAILLELRTQALIQGKSLFLWCQSAKLHELFDTVGFNDYFEIRSPSLT